MLELFPITNTEVDQHCPPKIQALVKEFAVIFDKPQGVPPKRPYVHTIPFIPGAQPFKLRPYRYNLAQKDEIEKQLQELLQHGMIQASTSPFASPVLLVK